MKRVSNPVKIILTLLAVFALSGCGAGQASSATATAVDVNAVMTSAAATAFVQLTQIAGQATSTSPATATTAAATATQPPALLLSPTVAAAGTSVTSGLGTPTPLSGLTGVTAIPSLTALIPGTTTSGKTDPICYNSKFVADITIPDGTVMQPFQKFTKIWAIQNTGTCTWDQGFGFVLWAGPDLHGTNKYFSNNDAKIPPGSTIDMTVEMRAPTTPGDYVAHWIMINDQGKTFGGDFTVYIKVK